MAMRMLIDARHTEETRVAVLKGNRIEEFDFESAEHKQIKGNIYLAKVTRVEPSLQAAFVDFGGNRHGFLAFSEIHPDYYQIPKEDREALLEAEAEAAEEEARLRDEEEDRGEMPGDEYDADDESSEALAEDLAEDGLEEVDTSDKDDVATIEEGHLDGNEDDDDSDDEGSDDDDDKSRGRGRGRRPRGLARREIEAIPRRQEVELAVRTGRSPGVVDDRIGLTDHLEVVASHDDGRVLIEPDAEQLRMRLNDLDHVELAVPLEYVLVDAHATQIPEADLVVTHHDGIGARVSPDQERALDGRACGRSADHPTAVEHLPDLFLRLGAGVGVYQMPLSTPEEVDRVGGLEWCHEFVGIGLRAIRRVQHGHVASAVLTPAVQALIVLVVFLGSAGRRDHDDVRVGPARQLEEALIDLRRTERAAHDHQRSVLGSHLRGRHPLLRECRRRHRQHEGNYHCRMAAPSRLPKHAHSSVP